jgi:hypothetical protein
MKYLWCLLLASLFSGCYADTPYDSLGPVAISGPTYYSAYPCEWGTCYFDGPRMVYSEHAPVRLSYRGVGVRYFGSGYVTLRPYAKGGPLFRVQSDDAGRAHGGTALPAQLGHARPIPDQPAQARREAP